MNPTIIRGNLLTSVFLSVIFVTGCGDEPTPDCGICQPVFDEDACIFIEEATVIDPEARWWECPVEWTPTPSDHPGCIPPEQAWTCSERAYYDETEEEL